MKKFGVRLEENCLFHNSTSLNNLTKRETFDVLDLRDRKVDLLDSRVDRPLFDLRVLMH